MRLSCVYNGVSYTGKTSLYRNRPLLVSESRERNDPQVNIQLTSNQHLTSRMMLFSADVDYNISST